MSEACCSQTEARNTHSDLSEEDINRPSRQTSICPDCGKKGKPVEGQTVKANLSVSLREFRDLEYYFCPTETCPVVYFSGDGNHFFNTKHILERVYQKEPQADNVLVCYCFNHSVSEIRNASPDEVETIIAEINTGIIAGQCACDLRNPQRSRCLGNVRKLMIRNEG